ncbi:MAG: hypothetical protein ABIG11_02460, partial [bacterium]
MTDSIMSYIAKRMRPYYRYPEKYPKTQHGTGDVLKVNFPSADGAFDPPLFYPTELWTGGSRWGFADLKNAFL